MLFAAFAEQIHQVGFSIIVIGHDGGESEEEQGDRHHQSSDFCPKQCADGRRSVRHIWLAQLRHR